MLKRLFDIAVSLVGLLVFSPLLVGIAISVKLSSSGPILYRGRRAGRNGTTFQVFKFRSMVIDADKLGGPSTSDTDPRITPAGRFMRKYKLDELPQLFNVLRGEMSLVGPRPQVPAYVERFTAEERAILSVRPGITDWASIWNADEGAVLANHPDPDRAYDELIHPTKTQLQLSYVQHNSVWIDLHIILCTIIRLAYKGWTPQQLRGLPAPGELAVPAQRRLAA